MRPDQIALLQDTRLSDQARIIGLYLSEHCAGEEPVELPSDEISMLLNGIPVAETVRRHIRHLLVAGYVEKSPGGRGHSDSYRWIAPQECGAKNLDPQICGSKKIDPQECGSKSLYPHRIVGLSARSSSSKEDEVVVAGAREGELNVENLDPRALAAMGEHQELMRGCRGALKDYLLLRVSLSRQYGYVQTIASWMAGIDASVWRLADGSQLPPAERTGLLAVALNELLGSDEAPMSRPAGDPGNLRTKVSVLLRKRGKQAWDGPPKSNGTYQAEAPSLANDAKKRQRSIREEERRIDAQVCEQAELRARFDAMDPVDQEEVRRQAAEIAATLITGGVRRSKVMEDMCLLQAMKARTELRAS